MFTRAHPPLKVFGNYGSSGRALRRALDRQTSVGCARRAVCSGVGTVVLLQEKGSSFYLKDF
jgi:hypothetical protein